MFASQGLKLTLVTGKRRKDICPYVNSHDVGPQSEPLYEPGPRITKIDELPASMNQLCTKWSLAQLVGRLDMRRLSAVIAFTPVSV
jgi:hypothetical protein